MTRTTARILRSGALAAASLTIASAVSATTSPAQEVNIYSYRQPELIQPLLDAFTAETGVKTNVLFLEKGLEERIEAEGQNSPADVILSVDIGRLDNAKSKGITQPLADAKVDENIPAQYRDPEGHWFALTTRGRVVYASKERVAQDAITYEELADPKWKGKICVRDGQHVYNVALVASMIANKGAEFTETWLAGVRDNLARKPAGGDRDQAKAIFAGECDVALGNTYYVGLMQTNEKEAEQKDWAASIKVLFPNAGDRGTHVNVSGMSLARHAPNKDNAVKLMEFLASPKAQEIYAQQVYEYPVAPGTAVSDIVKGFGEIKPDTLPIVEVAKNRKQASELIDKTGFNNGPQS
ncbi:MAG TPA: Fe(3+) ABC transporter substrate-binding protein [Rhizobiaceae bacterium]|nr:Fe(3+) ABC transporter substrate-binding protein [Rhizobiaceae bacterium]